MNLPEIIKNNQAWLDKKLAADSSYFEELAKGQSPEVLYIGCSDSRVCAENMMGAEPGDVFVTRNIANVVNTSDLSAMSVINYAVVHLKVKRIVVCGHYYCGGVKAAMGDTDLGILNPWLRNIRDVYRLHQQALDAITDEEARYKRLVELNVQEQCVNLCKLEEVQAAMNDRDLEIHGVVFDIGTGKLVDLNLNVKALTAGLTDIYKVG